MKDKLKLWLLNTEISLLNKKYIYITYNSSKELYDEVFYANNSWITESDREKLRRSYGFLENENLLGYIKDNNIGMVIFNEENYPQSLIYYSDCPFGMFFKGDISIINKNKNLSVVGSRNCTRYGSDATDYIIYELRHYEINIVSGLGRGIDSAAHRSAIKNKLKTVAILGCGINVVYPKENKNLYEQIINEGGCIFSEFPLGTKPLSLNFPIRNRIISGMSDGVLIIEGGEKSGTLITAGAALNQGKDIVVVPGSIFSLESKGTNKLIGDGARIFNNIQDILDLLNIYSVSINNNREISIKNPLESKLCNIINDNPIHIDNIIKLTHIDINQLYKLLFELQAKKEILCLSGNFYVRVNNMKSFI